MPNEEVVNWDGEIGKSIVAQEVSVTESVKGHTFQASPPTAIMIF